MTAQGARFAIAGVEVSFQSRPALRSITLDIEPGEHLAFVGPSGAGKTSLLRLLNATLRPTAGTISVNTQRLDGLTPRQLKTLRASIGFVHQDLNLVPNLRVSQNVLAGRLGRMGFFRSLRTMIHASRPELRRVHQILGRVGIPEKIFERTDRLSGGQRQRVAIARALYQEATALLVDEPVSSLDPARARDTIELLTSVASETGMTLVASMHDLELAREFFPRLVGIRQGKVAFDRPPAAITEQELTELYRITDHEMLADGC